MSLTVKPHVYLLDRLRGGYVDAGVATGFDMVARHLSAGRIRIAHPNEAKSFPVIASRQQTGAEVFQTGFDR